MTNCSDCRYFKNCVQNLGIKRLATITNCSTFCRTLGVFGLNVDLTIADEHHVHKNVARSPKVMKNEVVVKIGDRFYRPESIVFEYSKNEGNHYTIDIIADERFKAVDFTQSIRKETYKPEIKKVHFNAPATVVLWTDGTKTVVKCQDGDEFDPEKGLAMAIAKKVLGNKGSYFNEIKKWTEPYYEEQREAARIFAEFAGFMKGMDEAKKALDRLAGLASNKKEGD